MLEVTVDRVATGRGGHLLVVDFRRPDASPTLTSAILPHLDLTVCRVDPVTDLTTAGPNADPAGLAAAYAGRLTGLARPPDVVAGLCNAGTLTLQVVQRLAEQGREVPCVLVDPSWPDQASIRAEFAAIRASLGVAPTDACDLTTTAMTSQLEQDLLAMFAGDGVEPDEARTAAAALLPRYRAWLSFLVAMSAPSPVPPADLQVICGREAVGPAAWPPGRWQPTVLDLSRADLLRPSSPAPQLIARCITALAGRQGQSS